jgi:hypothetical protein
MQARLTSNGGSHGFERGTETLGICSIALRSVIASVLVSLEKSEPTPFIIQGFDLTVQWRSVEVFYERGREREASSGRHVCSL